MLLPRFFRFFAEKSCIFSKRVSFRCLSNMSFGDATFLCPFGGKARSNFRKSVFLKLHSHRLLWASHEFICSRERGILFLHVQNYINNFSRIYSDILYSVKYLQTLLTYCTLYMHCKKIYLMTLRL